jgi:hypothetical protein
MMFSPGSVFFGDCTFFQAAAVTGANDGTSISAGNVQLGNLQGALGSPGKLLDPRELAMNGFPLLFDQVGQVAGAHLVFQLDPAAGGLFEPFFEFQDSTGAVMATLRVDPTGKGIYFGLNNGTTAIGRQNVSIGDNTMSRCTTTRDTVAIGAQAGSGAGVVTPSEKNVFIGADNSDMGIGFDTGSDGVFIGANTNDNGVRNVGNFSVWLGSFINNGATVLAGDTGAFTILIGVQIGTGGNATNLTIIGNQITSLLSNLVLLGRFDQNVVVGAALAGETDDGNKLQVRGNISTKGFAPGIRTTATAAETFGATDTTIICDTTAGNINVSVNPGAVVGVNRMGWIKKKLTDANTVTITPTSGNIFADAGAAASFTFNGPGESIQFQSDGVNLYVL